MGKMTARQIADDKLCDAIFADNIDLVSDALMSGANPICISDARNDETVLHYAYKNGLWQIAGVLMNAAQSMYSTEDLNSLQAFDLAETKGKADYEILKAATISNDLDTVTSIMENDFPLNKIFKKWFSTEESLLHIAIKKLHLEIMKVLLAHNADIYTKDCFGREPFYYAYGNKDMYPIVGEYSLYIKIEIEKKQHELEELAKIIMNNRIAN